MFNGWARIYSGVTERRALPIAGVMLFLAICGLGSYVMLAASLAVVASGRHSDFLILAILHVAIMTMTLTAIYRMSGNPRRYALAFPLGGAVMIAIYAAAIRACRTGKIAWRGTSYTAGSATSTPPPPAASPGSPPSPGSPVVSPARAVEQQRP